MCLSSQDDTDAAKRLDSLLHTSPPLLVCARVSQAARREAEAEEGITEAIRKAAEVKKAEKKMEDAEARFAAERLEAGKNALQWAVDREKEIESVAAAKIAAVEEVINEPRFKRCGLRAARVLNVPLVSGGCVRQQ